MSEQGLDSSYILLEQKDKVPAADAVDAEIVPGEKDKYITILAPRKETQGVFLTPVKRTKRAVINGVRKGNIRVYDGSLQIKKGKQAYISLVECFRRMERAHGGKRERRESIDVIVKRYLDKK